jgi:hypothetical protein
MRALFLLGLLVGCDGGDTDTGPPEDTGDTFEGCTDTYIFVDGRETPQVGDEWTVLLKCADDDAVITGPHVVRVTPIELATVEENVLTFAQVGTGEIRLQVGAYRSTVAVTVVE